MNTQRICDNVINHEADKVSGILKVLNKLKIIGDYFMISENYVNRKRRTWTVNIYKDKWR